MKLNIGENIRKYRKNMNWTQEQLAEMLGASVQSVSRWESGGGYPEMELLPEIARTFAVSVDELMGYGASETRLTQEELSKMVYDAFRKPEFSPERAAQTLRMLRLDYLEDALFALNLRGVSPERLTGSREVMQELRLLTEEYKKRGKNQGEIGELIQYLAVFESEENFPALVESYYKSEVYDISRLGLHLIRAQEHKKRDLHEKLLEERKLKDILDLLKDHEIPLTEFRQDGAYDYASLPSDPVGSRLKSEKKLRLLHTLRDIDVQEKYPLSGDGILDVWSPAIIRLGVDYAAQLAVAGEADRALSVLEDAVGLIEQACDFADLEEYRHGYTKEKCPAVQCRTRELSHLRIFRALHYLHVPPEMTGKFFLVSFQTISAAGHRCSYWIDVIDMGYYCSHLTERSAIPRKSFRVPWLDPIRDHPRYRAVVERMEACRDRLIGQKENNA